MSIKLKDTIYDLINKATKDGSGNTITSTYLNKTKSETVTGDITLFNSSGTRNLFINGNTTSLRLFAQDTSTYIESGNTDFSNNIPLRITGIGGTTGSDLYLSFSNIYCRDSNYVNIDSGNYSSYAATKDHTHSGYALTSHSHNYLPLAGGILSGSVTFTNSGNSLYLFEGQGRLGCDSIYGTWIQFGDEYIGIKSSGLYWNNTYKFYHSGNISPVTTNTSQTITGLKTFNREGYPGLIVNSNEESCIRFDISNSVKSYIGYLSSRGTYLYNYNSQKYLGIKDDGIPYFDTENLLHSGNSSVSLSGSTLTIKINNVSKSLTNTTYTAGTGISLSGTSFSNSGVRSVATGGTNGTIAVNTNGTTTNVSIKGLGSAAYTSSSAYAAASHTHSYLPLSGGIISGDNTPLYLNTADTIQIGINFGINNSNKSWIGYESSYGTVLYQYGNTAYRLGINTAGTPYYMTGTTTYGLIHTGNISNYVSSSNRVKYLETIQDGNWWGDSYKMYANWETGTICKLTVDNYYTKTDYSVNANYATSAGNADTVDSVHNGDLTAKYIKDIGNSTSITVQYSGPGISSSQWICAWSGYKICALDQANINAGSVDGHHFSTVSTLPSSPNSSTVYFIT